MTTPDEQHFNADEQHFIEVLADIMWRQAHEKRGASVSAPQPAKQRSKKRPQTTSAAKKPDEQQHKDN